MANALSIPMAAAAMPNISPIPAGGAAGNALKSMAPAPMPAPQMSVGSNPYSPAKPQKNALLQGIGMALDGFQRGFDPQGWQAGRDQRKADGAEKAKQTLALMQQQRALPEQQRGQWWQQNAPVISQIIGQDVSAMPLDVTKFSDQALDGQIAALSAQLGIAPEKPAGPMTINNKLVDPRTGEVIGDYSDPQKPMAVNNRLVDPQTGQVLGDYSDPAKPQQSDYVQAQLADGVYFVNKNNPTDKIRLGAAPPKDGSGPLDPNAPPDPERIRLEREFSKDWKTVETDWNKIDGDYKRIQAMARQAASDPERASAADLALIVGFTKMQDPGSVAREGEVALTQQTVGVLDQANNLLNQWQNGKTVLPVDARVNILRAAEELHRVYADAYRKRGEEYAAAAQQYQYPVSRVMMGYNPSAPQQAPTMQSAARDLVNSTPPSLSWMTKGLQGGQPQPAGVQPMQQPRQRAAQFNVPPQAVQELMSDPSPEAMAEFDDAFGPGAAEAALNGSR